MKTVVCVPYGRKRFLKCLLPHLWSQKHSIDEIHLWVNTRDTSDLDLLDEICESDSIFKPVILSDSEAPTVHRMRLFYSSCSSPDTVYIKVDDDVVWMDTDCIRKLAQSASADDQAFLTYANTVNNNICTVLHQQCGVLDSSERVITYHDSDYYAFCDGDLVNKQHQTFFNHLDTNALASYDFGTWLNRSGVRMCINMVAWKGKNMLKALPFEQENDEHELSKYAPIRLGMYSRTLGDALCVHYSYSTQWHLLDDSVYLARYQEIAAEIAQRHNMPLEL